MCSLDFTQGCNTMKHDEACVDLFPTMKPLAD